MRIVNAGTAIANGIQSGDRVFIHGGMMVPTALVNAMVKDATRLRGVELVHLHVEGDLPYASPYLRKSFTINNLFVGSNTRDGVKAGASTYTPSGLSMIPKLFADNRIPLDVAMVSVSPPDEKGEVSLGTSVDVANQAVRSARIKIAQVNTNIPKTHGTSIPALAFDYLVFEDTEVPVKKDKSASKHQSRIGELVAEEIEDGSVIQLGIGAISNIVATKLTNHKNIGVHTEMITDTIVEMVNKDLVHVPVITSFAVGSEWLLYSVNRNKDYRFLPIDVTNNFTHIASHQKFCAVNNVVEVDLLGGSVCDRIGSSQYSGIGGQMDFTHAAMYSNGGQSFLCLKSITSGGASRIVSKLHEGATVPRHLADWIVTENGKVRLLGMSDQQRIKAMISIANPCRRDNLLEEAHRLYNYGRLF